MLNLNDFGYGIAPKIDTKRARIHTGFKKEKNGIRVKSSKKQIEKMKEEIKLQIEAGVVLVKDIFDNMLIKEQLNDTVIIPRSLDGDLIETTSLTRYVTQVRRAMNFKKTLLSEEIMRLHKEGKTLEEIPKILGLSQSYYQATCVKLGLKKRKNYPLNLKKKNDKFKSM